MGKSPVTLAMNAENKMFTPITSRELVEVSEGTAVLGVEATRPDTVARCNLGNVDPQHADQSTSEAAIDIVAQAVQQFSWVSLDNSYVTSGQRQRGLAWEPDVLHYDSAAPAVSAVEKALVGFQVFMVTDRPDLDSVGAMALLDLLREFFLNVPIGKLAHINRALASATTHKDHDGQARLLKERDVLLADTILDWKNKQFLDRVKKVSRLDRFAVGQWHVMQLPSATDPWPEAHPLDKELAALAALCSDHSLSLPTRVQAMKMWLATSQVHWRKFKVDYREAVHLDRLELITSLTYGDAQVVETDRGLIATVESTARSAMAAGYSLAPVVIARNPAFRWQGGEPHSKFTIAQYNEGYVNLPAVFDELNQLDNAATSDNSWGGSPTIGGSPQGVSSELTAGQILEVVKRHLI